MKRLFFGSGASSYKDYDNLYSLIRVCLESGIRQFDTAPSYKTEEIIGNILQSLSKEFNLTRTEYFIQTKIDPWQMQEGNIEGYVENVLRKMHLEYLDSLLIHWPVPDYIVDTWSKMVKIYQRGLVKQIGICNVRLRHISKMLQSEVVPHIVQIERNPLRICRSEIKVCHEHNIEVQAYSPLCKMDSRIKDNLEIQRIAEKYKRSVGQIVLRWHVDTGVTPIFTSKKENRIKEYSDIFDFSLDAKDIEIISALNENYKIYLESCVCPGF